MKKQTQTTYLYLLVSYDMCITFRLIKNVSKPTKGNFGKLIKKTRYYYFHKKQTQKQNALYYFIDIKHF